MSPQKVFLILTKLGVEEEVDKCYTTVGRMTRSKVKVTEV